MDSNLDAAIMQASSLIEAEVGIGNLQIATSIAEIAEPLIAALRQATSWTARWVFFGSVSMLVLAIFRSQEEELLERACNIAFRQPEEDLCEGRPQILGAMEILRYRDPAFPHFADFISQQAYKRFCCEEEATLFVDVAALACPRAFSANDIYRILTRRFAQLSLQHRTGAFCNAICIDVLIDALADDAMGKDLLPVDIFRMAQVAACNPRHARIAAAQEVLRRLALDPPYINAIIAPQKKDRQRNSKHRLKIAVCISGQLRGFSLASQTISSLGLYDHDLSFFVHTWSNVGYYKINDDALITERKFRGRVRLAFLAAKHRLTDHQLLTRYPQLVALRSDASAIASAKDLSSIYKDATIVIENEDNIPFSEYDNQQKMHYKIFAVDALRKNSPTNFDVVIRMRPDLLITPSGALPDWHEIAEAVNSRNVIYAENERFFHPWIDFSMGDQVAIGSSSSLSTYADAFHKIGDPTVNFKEELGVAHRPHATLGIWTFLEGIEVSKLPFDFAAELIDPNIVSPEATRDALTKDIRRPVDDLDQALLDALHADIEAR